MQEILQFLSELRNHNERDWFHANHAEWKGIQARFNTFVEELIEAMASIDSSLRGLAVKDCTYRLARDTRFSNDKTPYKTHLGAYIAPHGKKGGYAGYYFHVEPEGEGFLGHSLLTAGLYCPDPVVLRSVRDEILDNGAQIAAAIDAAQGFTLSQESKLKRTPKGYPSGGEYDELLKLKDIYIEQKMTSEFLLADNLLERTVAEFSRTMCFTEILNRAVQYAHEEMM